MVSINIKLSVYILRFPVDPFCHVFIPVHHMHRNALRGRSLRLCDSRRTGSWIHSFWIVCEEFASEVVSVVMLKYPSSVQLESMINSFRIRLRIKSADK